MTDLLHSPRIIVMFLLISMGTVYATFFTPALPELSLHFGVSTGEALSTMTLFVGGYAVGQLPYGPLANRFGRKKTIYIGLFVTLAGTLISLFSHSFFLFCIGRFIQAIGCAMGLKITFTIVGDLLHGEAAARILSYLMFSFGAAPGIGMALGGLLTTSFGWRGCFTFLALYTIGIGVMVRWIPETAKELKRDALHIKEIWAGYLDQLKNRSLVLHALLMGCVTAIFYLFAAEAPHIGIERAGLHPHVYGLFSLIPSIGLAGGYLLSAQLAGRIRQRRTILIGIILNFLGTALQFIYFSAEDVTGWTLFLPPLVVYMGNAFIFSNSSSYAISSSADKSNASAVIQFLNIGVSFVVILLASRLSQASLFLPIWLAFIAICMLALWIKLKSHHSNVQD